MQLQRPCDELAIRAFTKRLVFQNVEKIHSFSVSGGNNIEDGLDVQRQK